MAETRVTMGDIAKRAGVSKATVSRVLNDSPLVAEATKARVCAVMMETEYEASWSARVLATGRTNTIGIVLTEPLSELWGDPTFATMISGIHAELDGGTLMPMLLHADTRAETQRLMRFVSSGTLDGVIHVSPYRDGGLLSVLRDAGVPTVLIGRPEKKVWSSSFSVVYSDDVLGARLAASHLHRIRRTFPVVLMGPRDNPASHDRIKGYRVELGSILSEDRIFFGGWDEEAGQAMMRSALDRFDRIDAVLAGGDRIAFGALDVLADEGVDVPSRIAVIGFDGHPRSAVARPPLTTVAQPMLQEGRTAVALVRELLAGGSPRTEILGMSLAVRASA